MRKPVVVAVIVCTVVAVSVSFLAYGVYTWRTSLFFGFVPEAISMSSPTEGWVVGQRERFVLSRPSDRSASVTMSQQARDDSTVALHLHDGRWSRVRVPVGLWNVFTVSADDAWASSLLDGLYHWDGTMWRSVPDTQAMVGLTTGWGSISMLSATDGWAVNWGHIWHFTDGHWVDASNLIAEGSSDARLFSVTMVSATDGWAVGLLGVILHYDGNVWKKVESPVTERDSRQAVDLNAVAMVSSDEGWAVGTCSGCGGGRSFILHYAGGRWTVTDGDMDADLKTLAMVSPNEGWAATPRIGRTVKVGNVYTAVNEGAKVLHYHDGHWRVERVPGDAAIEEISMGSPSDGWALTYNGLLHYHAGVWEQFSQ